MLTSINIQIRALCAKKRAQCVEIAHIIAGHFLRSFEKKGGVRKFRRPCDACQCFASNMSIADVLVAINARIVFSFGIIKMNNADIQ